MRLACRAATSHPQRCPPDRQGNRGPARSPVQVTHLLRERIIGESAALGFQEDMH